MRADRVCATVDQLLLDIHANAGARPYNLQDFNDWWNALETAGLRAYTAEANWPAIYWNAGVPWAIEYSVSLIVRAICNI